MSHLTNKESSMSLLDTAKSEDVEYNKVATLLALINHEDFDTINFDKFLQEKDLDINYVIPSTKSIFKLDKPSYRAGNTILQVAAELFKHTICKTLIEFGADFTRKNSDGFPLLCLDSKNLYNQYCFFKTRKSSSYCEDFADIVLDAHMHFGNTINPSDPHGISHFHHACMYNKVDLVELFLKNGVPPNEAVNKDSPVYPGYTPLHFSAKYGAVETVQLLLKYGADEHIKDSRGLNPLHVLIDEKLNTWNQLIRRLKTNHIKSYYTELEEFHTKIESIIILLIRRNKKSGTGLYDDTGLTNFHVICTLKDTSFVQQYINCNKVNLEQAVYSNSTLWPGYSPLHFAAHFNVDTVRLLLIEGANLGAKDAKGITPFDICLNGMKLKDIYSIYMLYPPWANIYFSDGRTKLSDFIYILQNTEVFQCFMKHDVEDVNMTIPFDSPICAGYTVLHFSMLCNETPRNLNPEYVDNTFPTNESFSHLQRMYNCLAKRCNAYAKDARSSTPIHMAFKLQETDSFLAFTILEAHRITDNIVDEDGLSLLQMFCAARYEKAVEKILSDGANVNETTKSSLNWYEGVRRRPEGRDRNLKIAKGSTPLHIAVICKHSSIVKVLLDHDADVLLKDEENMTALEKCLEMPIFENSTSSRLHSTLRNIDDEQKAIIEMLVMRVAEKIFERPKPMLYCYSFLRHEILSKLFKSQHVPTQQILQSVGITPLHVACFTKNLSKVDEQLMNRIDVNARVDTTSPFWPGCTPLHILMTHFKFESINTSEEHIAIANLLLQNGADVDARNVEEDNTPFDLIFRSYIHSNNNGIYVDMLLSHVKDFSHNPTNLAGFSYLHAACARNNVVAVENFLKHGANVNQAVDYFDDYFGGFTPLHFAATYQANDAVDVLLKYGADVHLKTVLEDTPLHIAAQKSRRPCSKVIQSLISAGADMNVRNILGDRPLEKLMKSDRFISREHVALFMSAGCRVNVWNPMNQEGCLALVWVKDQTNPIFKAVLNACDIMSIDGKGRNAIHNVASFVRYDWDEFQADHTEELNDSIENYTDVIERLTRLGLNIDQQDSEGSTPLHVAAQLENIAGIVGLLNNGANINIVDKKGKSAFALSFELLKQSSRQSLGREILRIIAGQMYKLKSIGNKFNNVNEQLWQEIANVVSFDTTWCEECGIEVLQLQLRQIQPYSITFSDFLSDTGVISHYPRMSQVKKDAINDIFIEQFDEIREDFPKYSSVLFMQYRKAIARVCLIEPAIESMNFLIGFDMPILCTDNLLRYLSNDELESLIASTDE